MPFGISLLCVLSYYDQVPDSFGFGRDALSPTLFVEHNS
jgi:hypothetical protein